MSNLEITLLIMTLAAISTVVVFLVWSLWPARNRLLLRCPQVGAIAVVRVQNVSLPGKTTPSLRAIGCDLWPLTKPCSQGCLKRGHEAAPRGRVNIDALRPYEHP